MAEAFPLTTRDSSEPLCHKDDDLHGEDDEVGPLALSDAIAKSILESEEWPSYVERLRQVGDDDEHIEGLLRAERPCQQYPVWNADHVVLENVGPALPPEHIDAVAQLPSCNLKEQTELSTACPASVRSNDLRGTNISQSLSDISRSNISDSRQAMCFTPDNSTKSSSRSVFLSSPFSPLKMLDIIEEDESSRGPTSPSQTSQGTNLASASRFVLGRSKSRNIETGSKGTSLSKNSAEWSPDIEQLRASLVSSGSSGEGDLFKSSFRISKSGSSILALEQLFMDVVEASNQDEFCILANKEDVRCAFPQAQDYGARRQAPATSCTASKRLPLQRLGRGAFGRVFGVQIKGRLVAVKDVRNVDAPNEQHASQLVHKHVVRTFCVAPLEPRRFLVVMEYGGPHTLQHLLDERGPLGTLDVCRFGRQMASALHYCHRNNVLHLDVKPSNVLVHNGDCKLADFGSSAIRGSKPKVCGTVQYMAPEVLQGQRPEFSADVYSLGVVLWQLQTGARPFGDLHQHAVMFQVVRLRARPKFGENDGVTELRELVHRCWSHECGERPSVGAVLLELSALHKETLKSRTEPG